MTMEMRQTAVLGKEEVSEGQMYRLVVNEQWQKLEKMRAPGKQHYSAGNPACTECAGRKCKCTNELTGCQECNKRGLICQYPIRQSANADAIAQKIALARKRIFWRYMRLIKSERVPKDLWMATNDGGIENMCKAGILFLCLSPILPFSLSLSLSLSLSRFLHSLSLPSFSLIVVCPVLCAHSSCAPQALNGFLLLSASPQITPLCSWSLQPFFFAALWCVLYCV